jgi:hypothetical protein
MYMQEAECTQANVAGTNCTDGRLKCQTANNLNQRVVVLSQFQGIPTTPDDVAAITPPSEPEQIFWGPRMGDLAEGALPLITCIHD